jgi:iron complex outermembrane receptor protein
MTNRHWLSIAAALSATTMLTAPSSAQTTKQQAQSPMLEEIVVTARKREESLMEVPLAITAFSASDVEAMNIKQLGDIMVMTPSFHFVNQQGGSGRNDRSANALVFRGLFLANNVGANAGGQLFIDGSPVIGAQPPPAVDVERIEILKGPQSAYFGRSTFVGAINFVTKDPATDQFKGRVSAEYSSWGSHDGALTLEGPLVEDRLAGRITGRHYKRGGPYANAADTNQKLGEQSTGSISGSLVATPTDDLRVRLWGNWFEDNDGPPSQAVLLQENFNSFVNTDKSCTPIGSTPRPRAGAPSTRVGFGYFCGRLPSFGDLPKSIISGDWSLNHPNTRAALYAPQPQWVIFDPQFLTHGGLKRHAKQASLSIEYDVDGFTLEAQTAVHKDRSQNLIDLNYRDGRDRPNPLFAASPTTRVPWLQFLLMSQAKTRDWSQELRITSPQDQALRFTVGGNYLDVHSPGGTVYGMSTIGPLFTAAVTQQDVSTPAVFGALYYDITDKLTATAEARYQWDKIKTTPRVGTNGLIVTGAAANPLLDTFKSFSPRVSLDYKFSEGSTVYALFSRGYRPGGFNTALVTASQATLDALRAVVPNAGVSYLQEKVDNYEAGIKATLWDGRARLTFTVYRDTWLNGQVQNNVPVQIQNPAGGPPIGNLIGLIVNNGKAILKGVEAEGQLAVSDNLRLSGSFGLNDTEIKSFGLGLGNCADCNSIYGSFAGSIGNSLPTSPKYAWSLSADYSDNLVADYDWFARVDWSHQGRTFTDFTNVNWTAPWDNVNVKLGVRNENLSLEAFVNNLTQNDESPSSIFGIDVFSFLVPPQKNAVRLAPPTPRSVGVRAIYNF